MSAVHLRRIDPTRNMRRFYRLDVQPDLFGGVLLFKEWGRIGARGRMVTESDPCRRRATASRTQAAAGLCRSNRDLLNFIARRDNGRGHDRCGTLNAVQKMP